MYHHGTTHILNSNNFLHIALPADPTHVNTQNVQVEPSAPSTNSQHHLPVESPYIRIVSKGRIIYRHPTAGRSCGKGRTRWEIERERNNKQRGGNRWAMWASQDEWESVKWMASTKVSQSSLNKLLKTKRVSEEIFPKKETHSA
jgi:hypothetical protein